MTGLNNDDSGSWQRGMIEHMDDKYHYMMRMVCGCEYILWRTTDFEFDRKLCKTHVEKNDG